MLETRVESDNPIRVLQQRMVGHGMLILLVGLVAGLGLLVSLIGGLEAWPGRIVGIDIPGHTEGWVRFHLGQLLNSFLVILVALVLPLLAFEPSTARRIGWLTVGIGWANTLFYAAALFAPNRALTFGDNRWGAANLASLIGLAPALVFTLISFVVTVLLAQQAFRSPSVD